MQDVVQSLWIGSRLSTMEQLAIRSFLECGHPFHLYAYGPLENVPAGTTICDGREILPEEEIFVYQRGPGKGSPSAFSNFFRYKMLLERGGWWSDLDAVCIKPLVFEEQHVTCWEREPNGTEHIAAGLIKSPIGSPIMQYCWDYCRSVKKSKLRWGQVGPRLLSRAIEETNVPVNLLPPTAFYPIDYWNIEQLVDGTAMPVDCHSVHFWNSQWKKAGVDPDGDHPANSIYEQLKRRFNVETLPSVREAEENESPASISIWQTLMSPFFRSNKRDAA